MACPVCDSARAREVSTSDRKGRSLCTVMCEDCGLVRNDPVPSDQDLARFYRTDYRREYKGAAEPRMRQVARNFQRVRRHLTQFHDVYEGARTVLDIGAGSGEYVFAMAERGLDVAAVEPNEAYAAYVRDRLGAPVRTGLLTSDLVEPGSQDVIHMAHVLEHLRDPVGALTIVRSFLTPGGVVFIEVPNILQYARSKSQGGMFHFGHIWNFSPATLRHAAGRAGLRECARTAERSKDTTSAFFEKSTPIEATAARDAASATLVASAIAEHYRAGPRARSVLKPVHKLVRSVRETRIARSYDGPAEIGRAILSGDIAAGGDCAGEEETVR